MEHFFIMGIAERLKMLLAELPNGVSVVATSKTHPNEAIMEAYNMGHRIFGENKVQELLAKHESLPKDIEWHFIGHLQTNKVKQIIPFITLIHGVDSVRLLEEINKQAVKCNRVVDVLLQIHIAQEESKFGLSEEELNEIITSNLLVGLTHVRVVGLMGMASNTDDISVVEREFTHIKRLYDFSREVFGDLQITKLSIGMSGDYNVAIKHGGNLIRVGSMIFGERDYSL